MPRGSGGRGHKSGHKGQRRHFTSPEELEAMKEKEEREREWREKRGDESSDEEKDDEKNESQSSEDESANVGSEVKKKNKDVAEVLEVDNPNRVMNKTKKVSQLDVNAEAKPELSRKEREEIERQKARANYQKLHAEGKTEEARSDLARLAIIKKQREEAAKKRDDEKKARDAAKAAKTETLNKALGKGKKT